MASVRVTGEAQTIAALRALQFKLRDRALVKAAQAGAEIAKTAIQQTAPRADPAKSKSRPTGPIHENIIIYKRRRTQEDQGTSVSLLVGPNKYGFYGYFLEHGIRGKDRVTPREFVDKAFKSCKDAMRRAVIDVLQKAVKAE